MSIELSGFAGLTYDDAIQRIKDKSDKEYMYYRVIQHSVDFARQRINNVIDIDLWNDDKFSQEMALSIAANPGSKVNDDYFRFSRTKFLAEDLDDARLDYLMSLRTFSVETFNRCKKGHKSFGSFTRDELERLNGIVNSGNNMFDNLVVVGNEFFDDTYIWEYAAYNTIKFPYPRNIVNSIFADLTFKENIDGTVVKFRNCIFYSCIFKGDIGRFTFDNCDFIYCTFDVYNVKENIIFNHCIFRITYNNSDSPFYAKKWTMNIKGTEEFWLKANFYENCIGIDNTSEFLKTLERDELGFICYKRQGRKRNDNAAVSRFETAYISPAYWNYVPGSFLEENVDNDRTEQCSYGINVGDFVFCMKHYPSAPLWKCRIRYEDILSMVIPHDTDGKFRAGRLELLEIVNDTKENLLKFKEHILQRINDNPKLFPSSIHSWEPNFKDIVDDFVKSEFAFYNRNGEQS
jgi:hypothetical protein